ncbi:MAG: Ig-like domain-containing protein [Pseudomonadota bacterium]
MIEDPNNPGTFVTMLTVPGEGTFEVDPMSGDITFTPEPNFNGPVTPITYQVMDDDGTPVTAMLTVMVAPVNDLPIAQDDSFTTPEDVAATRSVLPDNGNGMDSDPEGDVLTVTRVLTGTDETPLAGAMDGDGVGVAVPGDNGGLFTIQPDGTIAFQPNGEFNSLMEGETVTTSIVYQIDDGNGGTDTAVVTYTIMGMNDAPVVSPVPDQSNTDGEMIPPLDVSTTFMDPDGDPLTFTASGLPPGLMIDPMTGIITGTLPPDASVDGPYMVTITGVNPDGEIITTVFEWDVTNPGPEATDNTTGTPEDTPVTFDVVGDDTDPDGDPLTVTSTTQPENGTVVINPDGTLTYTPEPNFQGTDTFTYTISDGNGGTDTATVTVNVPNAPDQPTATPIADMMNVDADLVDPIDVSGNFSDPDGDPLTFTAIGLPPGLMLDPMTGEISGTIDPDASQGGPYTVTVTVSNPDGNLGSTTFTWTVDNPAPEALNNVVGTPEDTPVTFDVLGNDSDPDGDPLTVTSTTQPDNGTVVINPDGTLTYTPDPNFEGTDTFTYTIDDGNGGTDTATVTVNVPAEPDQRVAAPITDMMNVDGDMVVPVDVSTNFSDSDGDPLTFTANGLPPGLMLDPVTGVITGMIDPDASQNGPYDVTITATDPDGDLVSTSFVWTVTNPVPLAMDNSASTPEDTPITLAVLADDTDPDGDPLTVTAVTPPANGTVTINPDGTVTYLPGPQFNGTDTFTYTIDDGNGGTDTATVTITVDPVADDPVAPDVIPNQPAEDGTPVPPLDISTFVEDPDGDPLVFSAPDLPPGLMIDPDTGIISGTPDPSASQGGPNGDGEYPVIVTVSDPNGGTVDVPVTYVIENPPPMATDDGVIPVTEDTPTFIDVLDNDVDPDGDPIMVTEVNGMPLTVGAPVTLPSSATVILEESGSLTYTPALNQTGTDEFVYTIDDGEGGTDTATVSLDIGAENDTPVAGPALPDRMNSDGDTITPVDVSGNFSDPDGDSLTFTAQGLPPGLMIDLQTGVITGMLPGDASVGGPYVVTVTATDPSGLEVSVPFLWTVDNLPPVVVELVPNQANLDGETVAIDITNAFEDPNPDGDPLTYTVEGLPPGVTIDPDTGLITGTLPPDASLQEPYIVTLTANDGQGGVATETFVWRINNDNPALVTQLPNRQNTDGETIDPVDLGMNFADPDGDPLTFTAQGLPPGLMIDPDTGLVTGMLPNDASAGGPYVVVVTADDGMGVMTVESFVWTVDNIAPVLDRPQSDVTAMDGSPVEIPVAGNFSDPDGDPLTFAAEGLPPGFEIDPDTGVISGTLDIHASVDGPFTVIVTAVDPQGGIVTDLFTIRAENPAPVAGPIDPINVPVGESIDVDLSSQFTDEDGDPLRFTAPDLPEGLTLDPATGVLSGTPVVGTPSGPVRVFANDGDGGITPIDVPLNILGNADIEQIISFGQPVDGGLNQGARDRVQEAGLKRIAADQIILDTVNGVRSLNGNTLFTDGDRSDPDGEALSLKKVLDGRDVLAADGIDHFAIEGSSAFSSRIDVSGTQSIDTNAKTGQFVIDTFFRDNALYVETYDTIDRNQSRGFNEYTATLGDGRALPSWVSFSPDGLLIIDRPANVEAVTFKITGLRGGGGHVTRIVEIDTATGEIRELKRSDKAYGSSFSEQLQTASLDPSTNDASVDIILRGQR